MCSLYVIKACWYTVLVLDLVSNGNDTYLTPVFEDNLVNR